MQHSDQEKQDPPEPGIHHVVHPPGLQGHVRPVAVERQQDLRLRDHPGLWHGLRHLLLVHAAAQLYTHQTGDGQETAERTRLGRLVHQRAKGREHWLNAE